MKRYRLFCVGVILVLAAAAAFLEFHCLNGSSQDKDRLYEVEINRLSDQIKQGNSPAEELKGCSFVTAVTRQTKKEDTAFFVGNNSDYAIRSINGELYRFDYRYDNTSSYRNFRWITCIMAAGIAVFLACLFLYIYYSILKPFHLIQKLPYELAKGNLTSALPESKNHYFGRFLWGLDLLRQHLEQEKSKELALMKEKKTLVLSLSHDIKTPLSAIRLYSQALSRNLYPEPEKQQELFLAIKEKSDQIEAYVNQIMTASKDDFLQIDVPEGEFYLKEVMEEIEIYYKEKLGLQKTAFIIEPYENCILNGDHDRAVEVLQNLIENAIKYGDGKLIQIRFANEDNYRLITVSNTGCELKENELPHIFESFWRGSNVSSQSGCGLGLYICRQIMIKSKGDIFAACKNNKMEISAVFRLS